MELHELTSLRYPFECFPSYSCEYSSNGYYTFMHNNVITILQHDFTEEPYDINRIKFIHTSIALPPALPSPTGPLPAAPPPPPPTGLGSSSSASGPATVTNNEIVFKEHIPTNAITNIINLKSIFTNANNIEKQLILLDPLLNVSILAYPPYIQYITVKLSPEYIIGIEKYTFLMTLTNVGCCRIYYKEYQSDKWKQLTTVSTLVMNEPLKHSENQQIITTIDKLKSFVASTNITAIAWNNLEIDKSLYLMCMMENGNVYIYNIRYHLSKMEKTFSLDFHLKIRPGGISPTTSKTTETTTTETKTADLFKVNIIKWYSFFMENATTGEYQYQSYAIFGDFNGLIKLYRWKFDIDNKPIDMEELLTLHNFPDMLRVGEIFCEYNESLNGLLITLTKGSHLLVYLVDIELNRLIFQKAHNIGELFCTGIKKLSTYEYVLCTLNGCVKNIQINIDAKKQSKVIAIKQTDYQIKHINFKKYALYGITASQNNAIWFLTLYPSQGYDHLVLRQPAQISICSTVPTFALLKTITTNNITYDLKNCYDCLLALSLTETNHQQLPENLFIPPEFQLNEHCLYSLKLRLFFIKHKVAFVSGKNTEKADGLYKEIEFLCITIKCMTFYMRFLRFLSMKLKHLQMIQKRTCFWYHKLLMYYLKYDSGNILSTYQEFYITFCEHIAANQIIEQYIEQQVHLENIPTDKCLYCNESIDLNIFKCVNDHKIITCCITMIPTSVLTSRYCSQCKSIALDNLEDLQSITLFDEPSRVEPLCPFCDRELQIPFDIIENVYNVTTFENLCV